MKNNSNIIAISAALLVALAVIAGLTYNTLAADTSTSTDNSANNDNTGNLPCWRNKNLTPEQQSALEIKIQERQAKSTAVQAALDASDYDAWVKAVGADAPILGKINRDNFSKLTEAYNDMKKATSIMSDLGVTGTGKGGMIGGFFRHMGGGFGMMGSFGTTTENTSN